MLRANNVFGRNAFGKPRTDDSSVSDMLAEAASVANSMKMQDMARDKEMMTFQDRMAAQAEARDYHNQQLRESERTVFGPKKQKIIQYAPPTQMQQKFRQDEVAEKGNKFKMGQIHAEEGGKLATAMATGRLREEGET